MCETRDLGIMWSHWHTLIFEGDRRIDMKCVCPKDVKMLLQQARMMPPTPLQSSHSSVEERQWQIEVEDHQTWNARHRTVIARMKQHLARGDSMKVEVKELESLLGPGDSEVDFRPILEEARNKTRSRDL